MEQHAAELPNLEVAAQEAIEYCAGLVRINTVNPYAGDPQPGSEAAGQDYLEPLLREVGAEITRFEPPADIYEQMGVLGPKGRSFAGRPNLVAELRFGDGAGPRILLQGHIDTVGITGMTIPPFSAEIEGGRMWGRGTSDEKGGLAAVVAAMRAVARHSTGLRGSVVLLSVVDEECDGSGAGAMACLARGYKGDCLICVDGYGPGIMVGGSGVATARIVLKGSGGHASQRSNAPSALEKGLAVSAAVLQFNKERLAQGATVNLGVFRAGTHPSMVPVEASLGVNVTYSYEDALAAQSAGLGFGGGLVRAEFVRRVMAAAPDATVEWVKDVIPFRIDTDDAEVAALASAYAGITGAPPTMEVLRGWTDACWPSHIGKIPTMGYGAGAVGKSHTPDEYVEVAKVAEVAKVLTMYLYNKLAGI